MRKEADWLRRRRLHRGGSTKIKKNNILVRVGSEGEVKLCLPALDSLAVASPDGVVCQCWHDSQREFHAFHLLHFDVETVRCLGVFLPRREVPQCTNYRTRNGGLFKNLFFFFFYMKYTTST